jgi:hypothetical protein
MVPKRNRSAIAQYARANGLESNIERAITTLEAILPTLGPQSHSRVMVNRIGIVLLQETVTIVAPSCPDYSHVNGKYNFNGVGTGLPLLSQLHILFLDSLVAKLPNANYEIVVADQEAEDTALCARIGLTQTEFSEKIHQSIITTSEHLATRGWKVNAMTTRFPDLRRLEQGVAEEITNDQDLCSRIRSDTMARSGMYQSIGVRNFEDMRLRTIQTASQYGALAKIAAQEQILICNHETVNLGWYNRYNAAVLHNPISVY